MFNKQLAYVLVHIGPVSDYGYSKNFNDLIRLTVNKNEWILEQFNVDKSISFSEALASIEEQWQKIVISSSEPFDNINGLFLNRNLLV